jgi:hypothetical protein
MPSTNSATRNVPNRPEEDAGMNSRQPAVIVSKADHRGSQIAKLPHDGRRRQGDHEVRHEECRLHQHHLAVVDSVNSAFSFGMITTSFRLVMPPKMKNSANTNSRRLRASAAVAPEVPEAA